MLECRQHCKEGELCWRNTEMLRREALRGHYRFVVCRKFMFIVTSAVDVPRVFTSKPASSDMNMTLADRGVTPVDADEPLSI
jgi:hypothetical protein